jgi:serine/threonine protein kinase
MSDDVEPTSDVVPGALVLPGYREIGLLQRGPDFETHDAWSVQRYSRCVVKVIRAERAESQSLRARLLLEGRLLTSLEHPHLLRGYEVTAWPRPAIVSETLSGATLGHLLAGGRDRLATDSVAHLGCQLASALQYLHDNGYLHLDVKPGNVIVQGGTAKLIDLSLTQPPGPVARGLGTAAYLSPEQATGGVGTAASDVWGVGVTLYEASTGASPFRTAEVASASSSASSAAADLCSDCGEPMAYRTYPQASVRAPGVRRARRLPLPMAAVVDATLSPEPADRPTLREVHDGLRAYAGMADLPW